MKGLSLNFILKLLSYGMVCGMATAALGDEPSPIAPRRYDELDEVSHKVFVSPDGRDPQLKMTSAGAGEPSAGQGRTPASKRGKSSNIGKNAKGQSRGTQADSSGKGKSQSSKKSVARSGEKGASPRKPSSQGGAGAKGAKKKMKISF